MRHDRPWLEAMPTERLFDDLRIALQRGDWVFGGELVEELLARVGQLTEHQAEELEQIRQSLAHLI